ncbi:MAG: MlaC/ttg2D family ABC transporter substrate-binding protein [bacterium]
MNLKHSNRKASQLIVVITFFACMLTGLQAQAKISPEQAIEGAVQQLLDEFTQRRAELRGNKSALYDMVDEFTRPHFDFDKISKLVLAKNWKQASEEQRLAFGEEFRTLLIRTYATALFQYTGKETMEFTSSAIKERKGVMSATVESEVTLSEGPGIPVKYSMILGKDDNWKIYNMTIAGVNMVTSYRKTYGASIRSLGLDGLIESMREANSQI